MFMCSELVGSNERLHVMLEHSYLHALLLDDSLRQSSLPLRDVLSGFNCMSLFCTYHFGSRTSLVRGVLWKRATLVILALALSLSLT